MSWAIKFYCARYNLKVSFIELTQIQIYRRKFYQSWVGSMNWSAHLKNIILLYFTGLLWLIVRIQTVSTSETLKPHYHLKMHLCWFQDKCGVQKKIPCWRRQHSFHLSLCFSLLFYFFFQNDCRSRIIFFPSFIYFGWGRS